MKNLVTILILVLIVASCSKTPNGQNGQNLNYSFGGGVFVVNEGNYRGGNGSLSFYSYDSSKIFNDLFYSINGRPLGDVPNSMAIKGDKAYIVVNNSGKIEILDQATLESKATITGLISPRNISFINDYKAYVSSLYSDSVTIINLSNNSISGYINLRRSSESIAVIGNKAFISYWTEGKEIMVVNTLNDKVVDSIEVGIEPESMAFDKNGKLWVLCNGGWARQNYAELAEINPVTNSVEKTLVFPAKEASPTCLKADGTGSTLYYLDNGVRQMDISSTELPNAPIINPGSGQYFYKIGINPANDDVFITDAVDFVQEGYLLLYSSTGKLISKMKAGIIPGSMCFKIKINS
jgi:DNA-binding beta-propeller fold protein YncE